jgi:uncharacterized membrane protein YkvI
VKRAEGIPAVKIAGVYIGSVVGAGFASGQEILQFFVRFGNAGLIGILAVTLLFMLFGYIIMDLGMRLKCSSHLDIVRYSSGKYLGGFADILITFFLFGSLTAMLAGSGAMFSQLFGLHPLAGSLVMAVLSMVTVLAGFNSTVNSISFVVPFLILSALAISIASLLMPGEPVGQDTFAPESGILRNWLWSAILYVSYNTVVSIAILGPLGANAASRKSILNGAILGGLGLGIGMLAIYLALRADSGSTGSLEIPMIFVAGRLSPALKPLYAVILLAEIYTTAVGDLYGFAARVSSSKAFGARFTVVAGILLAWGLSMFGFSNLVKYLYPAIGYAGVIILASLAYCRLKNAGRLPACKNILTKQPGRD